MKITIIGAGEVGSYLAKILSEDKHDVTLIESDARHSPELSETLNAKIVTGNGASAKTLLETDIDECDAFLSMCSDDHVNIIACSLAKSLGAKTTIARIHHQTYSDYSFFNYQIHFGIDHLINPEALCAVEIAKSIRNPGRVAVENFAKGQIEVQQIEVAEDSKLINKSLKDIKLKPPVRIGYIQKGDKIEVPLAETVIEPGDLVTLVGPSDILYTYKEKFNPSGPKVAQKVTIIAASETGVVLAKLLSSARFRVRIIEKNQKTCEALAEEFPNISVIHGDGTSLKLLEEEQVGDSDYLVACTKDDEDNIMTCIQAKKLGVKHTQLIIHKSDYEHVLEDIQSVLGLETVVSPRSATVKELMRYIDCKSHVELASLNGGDIKVLEFVVSTNSPYKNHKVRDIPWPNNTVVVGLLHKFKAVVPTAEDTILADDRLVVITHDASTEKLLDLLI